VFSKYFLLNITLRFYVKFIIKTYDLSFSLRFMVKFRLIVKS